MVSLATKCSDIEVLHQTRLRQVDIFLVYYQCVNMGIFKEIFLDIFSF